MSCCRTTCDMITAIRPWLINPSGPQQLLCSSAHRLHHGLRTEDSQERWSLDSGWVSNSRSKYFIRKLSSRVWCHVETILCDVSSRYQADRACISRPRESITFLSQKQFPNIPGQQVVTIIVTIPPGGATPPHRHGGAAVTACIQKGTCINQMNEDEPFECKPGDTFSEQPGCHHVRSENNTEEECAIFVMLVIDAKKLEEDPGALLQLDVDMEEKERNGEVQSK